MKITSLNIENFMAIGSAELDLRSRGLVLIQGENLDDPSATSNGAGKSSITDALSWCLYGVTARGETGDKVINNEAKSARVSVCLEMDDGTLYVIARHRKDKMNKNRLIISKMEEDGVVDLTLGTDKESQLRVNTIVGCDETVFNAAIYQGQEEMPDLPRFTDKQLKELVEETAGITVLQDCYTIAKGKFNTLNRVLERTINDLETAKNAEDKCKADLKVVALQKEEWTAKHGDRIDLAKRDFDEATATYTAGKDKLDIAEAKLPAIQKNIEVLTETLLAKAKCEEDLEKLKRATVEAGRKPAILRADIKRMENESVALNDALTAADSRIDTPCGECGKPIEKKDLEGVIAGIKAKIADKNAEIIHANKELKAEEVKLKAAQDAEDAFEMPDYTEASDKLMKCRSAVMTIETVRERVAVLKEKVQTTSDAYDEWQTTDNPHDAVHGRMVANLSDASKKVKELKKWKKDQSKEVNLAKKVAEVYSPSGVRAHILDHVAPFLNARTGHYLSALSDGNLRAIWSTLTKTAKGELREKFSIEVENATGGKSFGLLSGGEKRKVRLACAMALQDVVAQRASKPVELFMADEIDDALDEAGLERLMGLLDEKARERGTVLVISHHSLQDWIRDVAVVTKEGGRATITGALSA